MFNFSFSRGNCKRAVEPPIITGAPNYVYLDTIGGGQAVVVPVVSSAGITAVSFGGVAGTSVTIVDDTHVSAIPGAATAGVGDVVCTNPFGDSSTGGGLIEYFDPAAIVDLYVDSTQYTPSTGTWVVRKGLSNFTQGTPGSRPSAGATLGGRATASFDGSNDYVADSSATNSYVTVSELWSAALVKITTIDTNSVNGYQNDAVWMNSNISLGMCLRSTPTVQAFAWPGANKVDETSIATGAWKMLSMKLAGGKLYSGVNGSWSAGTTCGNITGTLMSATHIGRNQFGASQYLNGLVAVVAIGKVAPSAGDLTKFLGVLSQQWGVTF